MSYTNIQSALDTHLATITGLPPIQLENTANIGTLGQNFCRATLVTSQPAQLTVGTTGVDQHNGLYYIDLFVPANAGTTEVNELADTVIAAFPRVLVLYESGTAVHIKKAWRETGRRMKDEKFYQVQVIVQWSSIH